MTFKVFYKSLTRKKPMTLGETKLNKVLSTFDLTALGIGATLGVGVYILSGEVSKNVAGPGIVISFAIAAFASLLAGLCYAEFGARVPKAGSAYIYSFVTVGEFIAFLIGWNLILEYAIGAASVSKGISNYIDELANGTMSEFFMDTVPIGVPHFGRYADFFAMGLILFLSVCMAFGAKESTLINNVFTVLNIMLVLFVVITGLFYIDFGNWSIPKYQVPEPVYDEVRKQTIEYGNGGFLPYGFMGVIKGAAICFYAFIGFDVIATAGEEAKNPKKSIPIAVCLSLFIIFLAYFSVSSVLTLVEPYYAISEKAPFPSLFEGLGLSWAKYIVSYGAIFGMLASLFGSIFPLPRVIWAIASDGLIFPIFEKIHPRFKTPFYGTLIAGLLTGILACFFDLDQLIEMMSIGTFMAYSIVAACVMLLRYEVDDPEGEEYIEDKREGIVGKILNTENFTIPTKFTAGLATILVSVFVLLAIWMSLVISLMGVKILDGNALAITLVVLPILGIMASLILLSRQPQSSKVLSFRVPLTPWFPAVSIMTNVYLMTGLAVATWIRFFVWIAAGLVIYVFYGRRNSKLNETSLIADDNSNFNSRDAVGPA